MAWYDHFSDGAIHRAWSHSGDVTETTHLKGVCTYDKAVYGDDAPDASVADITLSRASIPSTYGTHKVRFRCGSEEGNLVTPFGLYNYIGYTDPVHGYNNFMFVLVQGVRACGMRFIVRALNTDFKWVAYDFVTGKWNEIPPRTVDNYSAAVEDGEWVDLECTMSKDSIRIKMLPTDGTGPLNVDVTIPKEMLYRAYDNSAGPTFPKNYISAYAWTHDAWFEWDYYSEDIEWPEDLATTSSTELYTTVTAPPMLNVGRAPIPDGDTYIGRRGDTGVDCREYLNRRTDFNDYFIKKAIKARGWRKITDLALRVQTIEQYVRDHINYAYDSAVYGVAEFFQYPKETWDLRQGDCEDWALIIKHFCDMAGVPEARVIINCGYVQSSQVAGGHAYCLYHRDDGTWTYLDPLCQGYGSSDVPINERPEFGNSPLYREVWWAFDRKKTYKFPDPGAFAYSAHIEHSLVCSCKLWEADVAVGLTGLNRLFIALEFTSKNALYMENSLAVRYGMCSVLYGSLEAKNNLTTRLLFALTVPVAILSRNPVSACLVARNTAGSTALVGATQYTIHLDGADITDKVEELSLELSEGNYTNTVSLTVVDPVLFDACKPDGSGRDRIVVTVDDDVFTFMLEDREDNLSFADFGLTVWGRSRTARLDKPYAVAYDEDYGFGGTLPEEESVTASSIIQALCSDCSVPVSVLDFTDYRISKGELAVGGRTPKQIIEDLAAASGCVLRSSKTGGLVLRRIRTTPSGAAVRLTDMDDVLEVSSSYEPPKGDNAVTVRGKQNRLEVAIEVDDGDNADRTSLVYYGDGRANTPVKLRVYTSPIASGAYSLLATDGTLKYYGTVQRTVVDEVVDVTSEVCQTAYPIVSLVSVDSNGTGLTARKGDTALDGKEILTNYDDVSLDAGVILVTYTTVYDLYELVGADTKVVVVYAIINPGADERFKDVLLTVQREGSGDASVGEFISNDLIVSEYQARVVAEAALEGWYYGKTVRRIDSVYKSVVDGGGVVLDVPSLGAVRAYKATDVTVKVERPVVSMSLVVEGDYVAPN